MNNFILNTFGLSNQKKKLLEEVGELLEAITEFECNSGDIGHIIEEMGDVMVLINQFKNYYEITDEELSKIMEYKVNRTLDRIKSGYYDR